MNTAVSVEGSFLQSYEWEAVQNCYGRKTARLAVGGRDILCIKNDLRFGLYYWYSPRPYIEDADEFFRAIRPLTKREMFFRVEPLNNFQFPISNFKIAPASNLQPRETILVNLLQNESELLSAMRPKTRYNIRVAERRGVRIEPRAGEEAIKKFYELSAKTAKRDNFSLHPKRDYECLLKTSLHSQVCENVLFFALHNGSIAAAAMVNFYKGAATYLHGASDYELRNAMAPYALHWEIIKEAKRRGCHTYDFGGIDETRWPGVTRFKSGFSG